MNSNVTIKILCEANKKIGFGHLKRSLNLYKYIKPFFPYTFIQGVDNQTEKFLPKQKYNSNNFKDVKINIIDIKSDLKDIINQNKKNKIISITLDYFGKHTPDYNIIIFKHKKFLSFKQSFVGLKYSIIRNDFLNLNKKKYPIKINNITIVMGGSDISNSSYSIALELSDLGFDVKIIYGPLYKKRIKSNLFKILYNPKNYKEVISKSDMLITNGGGCMLEGIFLNIPIIAIPQSKEEKNLVNHLLKNKAIISDNINFLYSYKKNSIIKKKLNFKIIDGLGMNRITNILTRISKK